MKEKRIAGESLGVSETTESWIERIKEFVKYVTREISGTLDESGCFSKALSANGLAQKGNKTKGGKKSKQRITVAFFVSAEGGKVGKPTVI